MLPCRFFPWNAPRNLPTKKKKIKKEGCIYLMVLPVLKRIHWGIGRFCFWALASFCLVRKLLWLCTNKKSQQPSSYRSPKKREKRNGNIVNMKIHIMTIKGTNRHLEGLWADRDGLAIVRLSTLCRGGIFVWAGLCGFASGGQVTGVLVPVCLYAWGIKWCPLITGTT